MRSDETKQKMRLAKLGKKEVLGQMMSEKHTWKPLSEDEKKNYKIRIPDFVEWELEYFRQNCNFSTEELEYFELRSKYKSNVEIALTMHISEAKVSKLARKVKDKIVKII